ncbi:hypothetical protein GGH12_000614 [Coemansia sp. RSA 1822]|nr:hypothetical protein LPJ76_001321 [Coemansia sp. RSA 638]KAJ2544350.1 hypothetical protein GGF49_001331 [Coemansia sp. RSA 1853]KAJ2566838.1 hypothetical protein GGH12_000614 [Coemansia sp. RSA 1822]
MSIPTVFTNANCITSIPGQLDGGGMLRFCRSYDPNVIQFPDECVIETQEDYNEYQLGCVGNFHGKFVDNNNNTVWIESKPGYVGWLKEPVEFPIGSHDNMHFVPVSRYEPPYPIFVSKENCDSRHNFIFCCPTRPAWSFEETPAVEGKCVLINDEYRQQFGDCCVNFIYGTYVDPIDGTTVTATGVDPKSEQPTDANTSHSTDSDSSSANPTQEPTGDGNSYYIESGSSSFNPNHTVNVTKCPVE